MSLQKPIKQEQVALMQKVEYHTEHNGNILL